MKLPMTIAVTAITLFLTTAAQAKDHRGERNYRTDSSERHHRNDTRRGHHGAKKHHVDRHASYYLGTALLLDAVLNFAVHDNRYHHAHRYDTRYFYYKGFHYPDHHGKRRRGHHKKKHHNRKHHMRHGH